MHYPVGPVFEYLACCESLIRNTNLLVESTAVSGPSVDDAGDDQTTSGRAGTSTAPDGGFGVNGVGGASFDGEQEKGGDLEIDVEGKGQRPADSGGCGRCGDGGSSGIPGRCVGSRVGAEASAP